MIFNKKYKLLQEKLNDAEVKLQDANEELAKTKEYLSFFQQKSKAKQLLDEAKKECRSKDDFERLNYLVKSANDCNYRDLITKTKSGKTVIDIHQMASMDYKDVY